MSRTLHRLSARFVATVQTPGRHADGGCLYLSISPNGGRRWTFFYRLKGRQREMGLGPVRDVSLAKAREKAAAARAALIDGLDPLDAKRARPGRGIPTFLEFAQETIAAKRPEWRNAKHADQWAYTLSCRKGDNGKLTEDGFCIRLRKRPVSDIDTEDVLSVLTPIWNEKPETAGRVRGAIGA